MSGVAGLAEIVLWVRDIEAALHFYRDMFGLEIISSPELPNKFLRAGAGASGVPEMIVLVPHPDRSVQFPREKPKRVLHHLAFRVDASAYDGLQQRFSAAGVEVRSGVHPVLKGVRTFYVDDPDGNECECISPDPAVGSPPGSMRPEVTRGPILSSPLDLWTVTLRDGAVLRLYAHAYSEEGDEYVFHALVEGKPRQHIEVARIPKRSVASLFGG